MIATVDNLANRFAASQRQLRVWEVIHPPRNPGDAQFLLPTPEESLEAPHLINASFAGMSYRGLDGASGQFLPDWLNRC
jgi:hypothetical protein